VTIYGIFPQFSTEKRKLAVKTKSIVAAISGNFVEWFDFALYLFLAPIIAKQFFPTQGSLALLSAYLVYAVSFFFRPFGALLFGHIGDIYGRSLALRLSISCLAVFSICIAFLPTYQSLGTLATVLLCLCRIGQGICLGGEFAGSMVYLGETASANKRSLCTSLSNNASNFGIMIAAGSVTLLSMLMGQMAFEQYGYRLLFLAGGIIGLLGFTFRADLKETATFAQMNKVVKIPFLTLLKNYKLTFIRLFSILIISALGSYALIGYMSHFLEEQLTLSMQTAFRYETFFLGLTLVFVPLFALLSDKYSPQQMLKWVCVAYIIFSLPCYYALYYFQNPLCLLPLVLIYSAEQSCIPALMLQFFPPDIRYTGVSTTYNYCMALIGGLSPLVCQLMLGTWKIDYGIGCVLMLASLLALLCLKKEIRPKSLVFSSKEMIHNYH
jgi:MHS family proline/betaine transporter-like MFS transporter